MSTCVALDGVISVRVLSECSLASGIHLVSLMRSNECCRQHLRTLMTLAGASRESAALLMLFGKQTIAMSWSTQYISEPTKIFRSARYNEPFEKRTISFQNSCGCIQSGFVCSRMRIKRGASPCGSKYTCFNGINIFGHHCFEPPSMHCSVPSNFWPIGQHLFTSTGAGARTAPPLSTHKLTIKSVVDKYTNIVIFTDRYKLTGCIFPMKCSVVVVVVVVCWMLFVLRVLLRCFFFRGFCGYLAHSILKINVLLIRIECGWSRFLFSLFCPLIWYVFFVYVSNEYCVLRSWYICSVYTAFVLSCVFITKRLLDI